MADLMNIIPDTAMPKFEASADYVQLSLGNLAKTACKDPEHDLRAHLKRFSHTQAVVDGMKNVALESDAHILQAPLQRMLRSLSDDTIGQPMNTALRKYDAEKADQDRYADLISGSLDHIANRSLKALDHRFTEVELTPLIAQDTRDFLGGLPDTQRTRDALQAASKMTASSVGAQTASLVLGYLDHHKPSGRPLDEKLCGFDTVWQRLNLNIAESSHPGVVSNSLAGVTIIENNRGGALVIPRNAIGPARAQNFLQRVSL